MNKLGLKLLIISGILIIVLFLLSIWTISARSAILPAVLCTTDYTCSNFSFGHTTGEINLSIEKNITDWSGWALAYAPQSVNITSNDLPDIFFVAQKGGFAKGEMKQISLNSSIAPPIIIGTQTVGSIWVCYVLNGAISATGKGYCQANSTVHYEQIVFISAKAS